MRRPAIPAADWAARGSRPARIYRAFVVSMSNQPPYSSSRNQSSRAVMMSRDGVSVALPTELRGLSARDGTRTHDPQREITVMLRPARAVSGLRTFRTCGRKGSRAVMGVPTVKSAALSPELRRLAAPAGFEPTACRLDNRHAPARPGQGIARRVAPPAASAAMERKLAHRVVHYSNPASFPQCSQAVMWSLTDMLYQLSYGPIDGADRDRTGGTANHQPPARPGQRNPTHVQHRRACKRGSGVYRGRITQTHPARRWRGMTARNEPVNSKL